MRTNLSITEVAKMTGMSVAFWRAQVFRRRVPFLRIGRRVLFDAREIEDMLNQCRVEPGPEGTLGCRKPPTRTGGTQHSPTLPAEVPHAVH